MLRELDTLSPPIISGTYEPPMEVTITHHEQGDEDDNEDEYVNLYPFQYGFERDDYTNPYRRIYHYEEYVSINGGEFELINGSYTFDTNMTIHLRAKSVKTTNPNWNYIRSLPFLKMCRAITMIIADKIKFK